MPNSETLGRFLRNPLTVFGLILLAGDGPLVVCYGLSRGTNAEIAFAVACIAFVFAIGGFFCFMVLRHTRKLFAPSEIPLEAIGRSIFSDSDAALKEKLEEIRKKVEAETTAEMQKLMKGLSDRFTKLMADAVTNERTIASLRPEIEALVGEAVSNARKAESESKNAEKAAQIVYASAIQSIQALFTCMDASDGATVPEQALEAMKRIEIAGAHLQIRFGDSTEVIAAVNKLHQLSETNLAKRAIEEGLKRQDLSEEAIETLRDRLFELEKRIAKK